MIFLTIPSCKATEDAFAALRRDGQVLCWGEGAACDGSWVYQLLGEVLMLAASSSSFLAIAQDGLSAVTWGGRRDRAQLPQLHCRAQQVVATSHSFAVLQEDGQVGTRQKWNLHKSETE